ncbi:MAG: anaerobic magnesium-protoporphyrin IX monomethyl ester cyclase [bacterium]|jgi:anaerobic magnesium-protoporphyrin IX monomethyl ester cyclase
METSNISLIALHSSYTHSSLALASLKAFCSTKPFFDKIHCHEFVVNSKLDILIERVLEEQPVLIGFSVYLWNIQESIRLAKILKQLLPNTKIVFGGPDAGPKGAELLSQIQEIDFVVQGEGEVAFCQLIEHFLFNKHDLGSISGLHWRKDDSSENQSNIIQSNAIQSIALETLPSPFQLNLVTKDKRLFYFETSRGCPLKCAFCISGNEAPKIFPIERIEKDIQVIKEACPPVVKILDRSFSMGNSRTLHLLNLFANTPDEIRFHLELNPDRIAPSIMEFFANVSGDKFQFEIGLQSVFEETLQKITRRMNMDLAEKNIRHILAMKKHHLHLDLIVGLPDETFEMCLASLDRVFWMFPHHLQLGILKILPGTALSKFWPDYGYLWDRSAPYEILGNNTISYQEISTLKKYAELLEQTWNNELFLYSLRYLIPQYFEKKISIFFYEFLEFSKGAFLDRSLGIDFVFNLFVDYLSSKGFLQKDKTLQELLLWDYCKKQRVTKKTPQWIRENSLIQEYEVPEKGRQKLPFLSVTQKSIEIINTFLLEEMQEGEYAVWLKKDQKRRPVSFLPVDPAMRVH